MPELDTTITAITAYADRARVTRAGTATLQPGAQRLTVPQLPLALDPASVRASARGTARARLLGVDVRREFYVTSPAERVRALEAQIEALEDELRGLEAQTELLQHERAVLNELAGQTEIYARGLAFGKTSAEAQMALLDSLRERAAGLDAALLELAVQQRELTRRLQKLQKERDQLRGAHGRERYSAVVEVEVIQAGDLAVELSYVVSNAGWGPLYDVRLSEDEDKQALEIGYLAQVTQRSGEDWPDAALTLSTARPALAETLPELTPWYIGPPRAARRQVMDQAMRLAESVAPAAIALEKALEAPAVEEESVEVEAVMAEVQARGAAVTYQVPGRVTVPADGAPHKVTVARLALSPQLDYVTAPKLEASAYRRAKVTNDSPYTLLPGPANLFAGDEFIGATELELIAPQGEIELYLGVDDRVQVRRELKRRDVDKRLIGDKRRLRYGYEITLENLLPSEARVTLHDQIPVPHHEDVKVKLESAAPEPTQRTELGLLEWELVLAPGAEQDVRFDFTVEHPRGMSLLGLP